MALPPSIQMGVSYVSGISLPGGESFVDTGCTRAVAGVDWLPGCRDQAAKCGLGRREGFAGLGGVICESKKAWAFPIGVKGAITMGFLPRHRGRHAGSHSERGLDPLGHGLSVFRGPDGRL